MGRWRICADTGGTFTDCVGIDPAGGHHRAKVLSSGVLRARIEEVLGKRAARLSTNWGAIADPLRGAHARVEGVAHTLGVEAFCTRQRTAEFAQDLPASAAGALIEFDPGESAVLLACRLMTGTALGAALPEIDLRLATTKGTNALLERRGAPTALFITKGFGDILTIGDQRRPRIFDLHIQRPPALVDEVAEVEERLDASGNVIVPLHEAGLRERAQALLSQGITAAAIALMHSDLNPEHERRVAAILREAGFKTVSESHRVAPFVKLLSRSVTATVDAYLEPVMRAFFGEIEDGLGTGTSMLAMTSEGSLVRTGGFRACEGLLSGPAAGVVGAHAAAEAAGHDRVISFDMGGTSTDVSRIAESRTIRYEHVVGDAHLRTPAVDLETVAAGGGSICSVSSGGMRVGPGSAGAAPGPACYAQGGPLAVTDVNLLLGLVWAEGFEIPISKEAASAALRVELEAAREAGLEIASPEVLLEGFRAIANDHMAHAIRRITIQRGIDPASHALVAFGGAGGQHACALAQAIGISTVVVPEAASVLSAVGLREAPIERTATRQLLRPLAEVERDLEGLRAELLEEAASRVEEDGARRSEVTVARATAHLRFAGQDATLEVQWGEPGALGRQFIEAYKSRYAYVPKGIAIEVESVRVTASWIEATSVPSDTQHGSNKKDRHANQRAFLGGQWTDVPVVFRSAMEVGVPLRGPMLVVEGQSTSVVEPGWEASLHGSGALVLEFVDAALRSPGVSRGEAVELELTANTISAIAGDMGELLRRSAISANVRERLDYSCAVLDAECSVIANAPHIPVHLGAMGACVREMSEAIAWAEGDVAITNHPGFGGSHLPDVTLVAPIHVEGALIGFSACRAHHAEIGGITPGSMPFGAASLEEEGVVIPAMRLVHAEGEHWDELKNLLSSSPYATRALDENIADIRAQIASVVHGRDAVAGLASRIGPEKLASRAGVIKSRSRDLVTQALVPLGRVDRVAVEHLDDGAPIQVRVQANRGRVAFDFTGSALVHAGGFNAPIAVVRSAVAYVLRLMLQDDVPLNDGLLEAVELHVPPGMLNPSFDGPARTLPGVAAGNVETSQRVVDALLKALDLGACGQGTMNNVTFGAQDWGYYETVCGGAGATSRGRGADAVHTHMTNTSITDAEIIERRFPIRLNEFSIRDDSGGSGRHRGGHGAVRSYTFLEPATLSILSQHRLVRPFGAQGGGDGTCGSQRVVRSDGAETPLDGCARIQLGPGDTFVLETPGAGGWGATDGVA